MQTRNDTAVSTALRYRLPSLVGEPVEHSLSILNVFLRLLSHVEDRAVLART
jgi:hypothetical protein